jgi:hypothetical protein
MTAPQQQLDHDDRDDDARVQPARGVGQERRRRCDREHEQEGG